VHSFPTRAAANNALSEALDKAGSKNDTQETTTNEEEDNHPNHLLSPGGGNAFFV